MLGIEPPYQRRLIVLDAHERSKELQLAYLQLSNAVRQSLQRPWVAHENSKYYPA